MGKRIKASGEISLRPYSVISRAVNEGIAFGYNRAFKYTGTPAENVIKAQIEEWVMNELSEVIDWGGE